MEFILNKVSKFSTIDEIDIKGLTPERKPVFLSSKSSDFTMSTSGHQDNNVNVSSAAHIFDCLLFFGQPGSKHSRNETSGSSRAACRQSFSSMRRLTKDIVKKS